MADVCMKVTKDKYQLPVAVAESAPELARICGTTKDVVRSQASHYRHGRLKKPSYICVEVDDVD